MSIGLDLLEIERLERALERHPALAERVFSDGERSYAARRARPAQHLAARFYHRHRFAPQSSSASRFTAGAAGFLLLIQCRERPET